MPGNLREGNRFGRARKIMPGMPADVQASGSNFWHPDFWTGIENYGLARETRLEQISRFRRILA